MGTLGTCPEPRVFFFLRGPNWLWWIFLKLSYFLLPSQRLTVKRKLGKYFLARGPVRLGVPRAPMQVKRRYCNFWLCPCWKRKRHGLRNLARQWRSRRHRSTPKICQQQKLTEQKRTWAVWSAPAWGYTQGGPQRLWSCDLIWRYT